MLTGLHILLTYRCILECDHCFVYSGPQAEGTFTLDQLRDALEQARQVASITEIYFEGGEPFLYYPLLLEGVRLARALGFEVGIVTNSYFATSEANAELFLRPLVDQGIFDLSVSDDALHHGDDPDTPARRAFAAAQRLGLPVGAISIEEPSVQPAPDTDTAKGAPIVGGDVRFRGRAVDTMTGNLPVRPWDSFTECPYENLADPGRVHLDSYGNIHLCQGLILGNIWESPLADLLAQYDPDTHPIVGPLLRGGPSRLAVECGFQPDAGYIEACHLCFVTRRALLDGYPDLLAPRQVYGV
jgi:hypothetical protein